MFENCSENGKVFTEGNLNQGIFVIHTLLICLIIARLLKINLKLQFGTF